MIPNLEILKGIKPNRLMPSSPNFVPANRITKKTTSEILASCIIKKGPQDDH